LEIGLAAGVTFGFFVRGSVVHAPSIVTVTPVPTTMTLRVAPRADVWQDEVVPGSSYAGLMLVNLSLVGRDLRDADFTGATLRAVDFTDADLNGARFEGATFDRYCRWPTGFDPTLHNATENDWPRP
jgi:Pentapeptide repeats (8 copies)